MVLAQELQVQEPVVVSVQVQAWPVAEQQAAQESVQRMEKQTAMMQKHFHYCYLCRHF